MGRPRAGAGKGRRTGGAGTAKTSRPWKSGYSGLGGAQGRSSVPPAAPRPWRLARRASSSRWPRQLLRGRGGGGVPGWYGAFLGLRFALVLAPGYIHPDAFFQCVDIAARDVAGADVFVPWEWGGQGAPRTL